MLIYEALLKDYEKIRNLLNELIALEDNEKDRRLNLTREISDELIPYARAEESILYNALRSVQTANELALSGFERHMEAEGLLKVLQIKGNMDSDWRPTARKLRSTLEAHRADEEGKLFAAAKHLFTEQEAERMGDAFEKLKPEIRRGSITQSAMAELSRLAPSTPFPWTSSKLN